MIKAGQVPSSEPLIIEKIVIPLCKALNAMHSHNILHLDIKPSNFLTIPETRELVVLFDVDTVILYNEKDDPAVLTQVASQISADGKSVLLLQQLPENLRCANLMKFENGSVKSVG